MTIRILLYAEGDFSYTEALCKQLVKEALASGNKYEIVATDFANHEESKIKEIDVRIHEMLKEKNAQNMINVLILTKVDATKHDARIVDQFDKIICNFPTPFGDNHLDITQMIFQIKSSHLLKQDGKLQIAYWAPDNQYSGSYEYAYRLARAQKRNGLQLKQREIFDIKGMCDLGYGHILHSGERSSIDHLPIVATYQFKKDSKPTLLEKNEYDELSDSEELENDALPVRWFNPGSPSHRINTLNFKGNEQTRWDNRSTLFNSTLDQYYIEIKQIRTLIDGGNYREADRRLTIAFEGGLNRKINIDTCYPFADLIRAINKAYEDSKIPKPESLSRYHNYQWYAKLKVLTGVKIPELTKYYSW